MSRTFSGLLVSLVLGAVSLGGCINPTVEPGSAGRGSQSSGAPVQHGSDRLRTVFWPCYELHSERTWQLNLPHGERFDASGLVFTPQGDLLTVSDQGASVYRIEFLSGTNAANLVQLPDCFTARNSLPSRS